MGKRKESGGRDNSAPVTERVRAETELYAPVKKWLEEQGFTVRGEVRDCDVVAIREGEEWPVIVELKRRFNLSLVLQAVQRLSATPNVYIAAELTVGRGGFAVGEMRRLCRMLGIGLLTVRLYKRKPALVEVHAHPGDEPPRIGPAKPGRRTLKLVTEFRERSGDYNAGGGTGRKLVTAYREKALRCAEALHANGPLSPRRLRELAGTDKAALIVRGNVYGWFRRVSRGVYELTPEGEKALGEFEEVVAGFNINKEKVQSPGRG
ncbi:DUF2161 domain-containing phosphodiesterase [Paenibacillus thermotolerans]|uniref:DUF2161 domain-containing phosphodiesterase n=1 Tax=Paenibacillus thermotolerans TaxID=3027807 RepID=UPI002368DC53|nr:MULTISPECIES: DUF2161 family putative PD-(D/E)XK-type phosphodiesterase [unclassified Paenibacillus]